LGPVEAHELKPRGAGGGAGTQALGNGTKARAPCELPNLPLIRKSLVAARDLPAGAELTRDMIEIKRPLGGIEPAALGKLLGRKLRTSVQEDRPITWDDIV